MMRGHKPDYYQAETPEELLVFLMGVYDWYPEGYEDEAEGSIGSLLDDQIKALLPELHQMKVAKELTRLYEKLGEEEYYRRLGICVAPGEEE